MSVRRIATYAALGVGLMTALPAAAEEQEPHWMDAPGIGVTAKIGNNRADGVKLFAEDQVITEKMKAGRGDTQVASKPRTTANDPDAGGDL